MAQGKVHIRFNMLIGALLVGIFLGYGIEYGVILAFALGLMLSTFIFSPDIDLAPGNKGVVLRFFLYPYSILFKHRGISHSFLFGTITRIVYSFVILILLVFIISKMGLIGPVPGSYLESVWKFIIGYNYHEVVYKVLTWFYLGMFFSDICHIFVDKISTFWKRVFN